MKEITQAEFGKYKVKRQPTVEKQWLIHSDLPVEKQWFIHGDLLGIVLFDLIDSDWSFVLLADLGNGYQCEDLAVSHPTQDRAALALQKAFESYNVT